MIKLEETISTWLRSFDLLSSQTSYAADWILFICGSIIIYLFFYAIRWLLTVTIKKAIKRKSHLSKSLEKTKFFRRIAFIPTLILLNVIISIAFNAYPQTASVLRLILRIGSLIVTTMLIFSLLNAFEGAYKATKYAKQGSIKGIIQSAKTIIYIVAVIFSIGILLNVPIQTLLGALAGTSAVLMLIFKDSILGLVAGIQLSLNKMVLPGDWIEMPSADADGNVIEISQITVKVQNWDNTITTIPAYDLISKPIKNWRGMAEAGVRRIKRSLNIDMNSIQRCSKATLEKYKNYPYLNEYITQIENKIEQNDTEISIELLKDADKIHPTNLNIYCHYLQRYLEKHPMISNDFTVIVRQLQSTNLGMPIEIYAFIKTTDWFKYEEIQAEIVNYVLLALAAFDLRIYQTPSWHDYHHGK